MYLFMLMLAASQNWELYETHKTELLFAAYVAADQPKYTESDIQMGKVPAPVPDGNAVKIRTKQETVTANSATVCELFGCQEISTMKAEGVYRERSRAKGGVFKFFGGRRGGRCGRGGCG